MAYIERTNLNGQLQNNIYVQRLSETEKIGSPILISNEPGDKKFVVSIFSIFEASKNLCELLNFSLNYFN